jgi:F-type H+-transporting ATPase subunit epsilon
MSEKFQLEIISPEKTLLNIETKQVSIPAYEGAMTILKDHISLITFLRPGIIEVELSDGSEKFYVEEGTVEFFQNKLLILSSSAINKKNLSNNQISEMIKDTKKKINSSGLNDKEKYILSYKENTLETIT